MKLLRTFASSGLALLLAAIAQPLSASPPAQLALGGCSACQQLGVDRRVLSPGVAEYSFLLRVGAGEHDRIRLHRVVRELAPFVPAPSSHGMLLAHGDVWGFDSAFLAGGTEGLPVFLAEHGVDVWGLDFRWTLVPADAPDVSFMADWSVETDAGDLRLAGAVARATRAATGNGFGKLILLGWSRGGQVGYAALGAEARLPAALRQFRGFVPVDVYLKTDVPELQAAACTRFAINQARFASGEVAESLGQLAGTLGTLALAAPNDPSPAVPGFTNLQASLLVAEATFTFFPPGAAPVPFYHFSGGTFDANGVPSGLSYSRPERFLSFLAGASPWQPLAELRDADAATCAGPPAPDVGWDDALGEIRVPVLYLGAGGGFGSSGLYTTTLLASADVSSRVVSLVPPEARLFDLGHADIFLGEDATGLFWQPLLSWVLAH